MLFWKEIELAYEHTNNNTIQIKPGQGDALLSEGPMCSTTPQLSPATETRCRPSLGHISFQAASPTGSPGKV